MHSVGSFGVQFLHAHFVLLGLSDDTRIKQEVYGYKMRPRQVVD